MTYFLILSAVCGGMIVLTIGVTKLFHNKIERRWRYAVWIALALRMLIPVDLSLPQPLYTLPLPSETPQISFRTSAGGENSITAADVSAVNQELTMPLEATVQKAAVRMDWSKFWRLLPWIWLTGALAWIFWFSAVYFHQRRQWMRWSYRPNGAQLWKNLHRVQNDLRIQQKIEIRICKKIHSPVMMGLFHPKLMMPEGTYTEKELRYIFCHELFHLKRRDLWIKYLMVLVRAIHWFNPLVLLMCRGMDEDIEILCDAQVVKKMNQEERRQYGEVLLKHMVRRTDERNMLSTCFGSRLRQIRERLIYVMKSGRIRKGYGLGAFLLIAVLLVSLLASCEREKTPEPAERVEENAAQMAQSYLSIMNSLDEQFGSTLLTYETEGNVSYRLKGVYRLLDFDGDGSSELYCSYTKEDHVSVQELIYQYKNGECVKVWDSPASGYGYKASYPCTYFVQSGGRVYLRWDSQIVGDRGEYLTLKEGRMVSVLQYDYGRISGSGECKLNNQTVAADTLRQAMNELEAGGKMKWIEYGVVQDAKEKTLSDAVWAALSTAAETGTLDRETVSSDWNDCVPRQLTVQTEAAADPVTAAYRRTIASLEALYGKRYSDPWYYKGLCMVKRIDFDGDGTDELYCAYTIADETGAYPPGYREEIYQYQEDRAVRIYWGDTYNRGTGENPQIHFLYKDGKVFLEGGNEFDYDYKELIGGQMETVFAYTVFFHYSINGVELSEEETKARIAEFEAGGQKEVYTYYTEFPLDYPVVDVENV